MIASHQNTSMLHALHMVIAPRVPIQFYMVGFLLHIDLVLIGSEVISTLSPSDESRNKADIHGGDIFCKQMVESMQHLIWQTLQHAPTKHQGFLMH